MRRFWACALGLALLFPAAAAAGSTSAFDRTTMLVMFDEEASPQAREALHVSAGARVIDGIPQIDVERVSVTTTGAAVYRASGLVRAVEVPRDLHVMGGAKDPLMRFQWGLRRIDANRAWTIERGKRTAVTVGVIDTGVDAAHTDLEGRVLPGFDFLDHDGDAYDDEGHGTHVAGIIAANEFNSKGIAGVSHGASIIPMKACRADGSCDLFAVYLGVIDAVVGGASILNLSLGGAAPCSPIDQAVFDWVHDRGVLAVVAAGNSGADGNPEITPASCDNTLGVGAIDQRGKKASFSSFGSWVDIAAPGVQIWSTLPPLVSIMSPYIGYAPLSGTSMATPFVAGAAALVKARHPEWSPDQIAERLTSTAVEAGTRGRDDRFGAGILDLFAALK